MGGQRVLCNQGRLKAGPSKLILSPTAIPAGMPASRYGSACRLIVMRIDRFNFREKLEDSLEFGLVRNLLL